jgi:hypothetical protein
MPPANDIVVRDATDADAATWNSFLDTMPESSPLARYEWRHVLEDAYRIPTHFLMAEREGAIAGLVGAYESAGLFGERSLYSLRCGAVAADAEAAQAILRYVENLAGAESWNDVLLTSGWRGLPDVEANPVRTTVQMKIDADQERIWRGLKDKTRNMIRHAEKRGVEIVSGLEQVDVLVDQYQENMLRLGVSIHSRAFFHHVVGKLGTHTEILVARHRGEPIASMMVHFGREMACYPFQNATLAYRNLAPIQLLNWAAMKRCADRGVGLLDMGESRKGSPVFQSKINFGGSPRDIFYYKVGRRPVRSFGGALLGQAGRIANVADAWLASRTPLPIRRRFAERKMARGRLM